MEIKVTKNEVKINKDILNDGEYNIHKCQFDFDEEYNGLVQKAVFTLNDGTSYLETIVNNECNIPIEVLEEGVLKIGVYAYETEGDELVLRYSPSPDIIHVFDGSYVKDAQNSEGGTPTEYEQLESRVNTALNEIDKALEDVETAVNEANNLDVDVSKTGKVATIDVTKKNGTVKTVTLSDGTSLQFKWEGTSLGIKTDNEESYTYVDLEGPRGPQGIPGPRGETGSTGPQGETGATGNGILSIQKTATAGLVDTYTITFTDGTTTTFDVTNGEDGEVTQAQLDESQAKQDTKIDWLQTLVNQMPTVSGQGTDLSLQSVLNYRLMKFLPQGVSSQDGEPTPTTPIPVKSVTGENSLVLQNENLFDKNSSNWFPTYIGQSSHAISKNTSSTNFKTIYIKCLPNTNYYIKKFVGTGSLVMGTTELEPTLGMVLNDYILANAANSAFLTGENANYLVVQISNNTDINSGYTVEEIVNNLSITKGSTAPSTYVEHEEQNYQLSLGIKNMLNINEILFTNRTAIGLTSNLLQNKSIQISGTATGTTRYWTSDDNNKQLFRAGTYTFFIECDDDSIECTLQTKGATSSTNSNKKTTNKQVTFTYEEDFYVYNGQVNVTSGTTYNFNLKLNLIEGTVVQRTSENPIELNSSPDGTIRDQIVGKPNEWYKREYIGKVVLDGSETWIKRTDGAFQTGVNGVVNRTVAVSNYFNYNRTSETTGTFYTVDNYLRFFYNEMSTVEDFKTWLSAHNTVVYYPLAQYTDIPITDTTLISQLNDIYNNAHSYNGTTNITTTYEDGNEQMYLDIEALKNVWEATE